MRPSCAKGLAPLLTGQLRVKLITSGGRPQCCLCTHGEYRLAAGSGKLVPHLDASHQATPSSARASVTSASEREGKGSLDTPRNSPVVSRVSGFAPRWARVFFSRWVKILEQDPFWSRRLYLAPRCFLTLAPPYLFASSRHKEVSVSQVFRFSGAGPATPPDRGNLHFVACARPGQRRHTARSLRYPGGYGPKGVAPSASFPLDGAAAGDAWLLPSGGDRSSRLRGLGHLQSGSAAEPHGPGPTCFSLGHNQPRPPSEVPEEGGTSRCGLSGFSSPCLTASAWEPAPRLGASGGSPLRRGPVFGTASFPTPHGTSEPRTRHLGGGPAHSSKMLLYQYRYRGRLGKRYRRGNRGLEWRKL
ncbi:hypothetical protein NDU88_006834 [Pleurodeles waltl]|uniref:Uncharacterized protein n=1 Tax=Pleurodeles waltl TaxID=8319 RepID=A0AAV7NT82_PLEWA|nr:hypothetical protein NDU88_006834 [Pleurodeles waltl]